ncbi:MAG: competence protein ComEA, partial [Solirubrobacteraceae bacterium]|nr:competence protein ComEA [Solirubrobacteraceae bacterium]
MSDLDRPRLVLYVALGLAVCLLGARYVLAQASGPAGASDAGSAQAPSAPRGGGGTDGGGASVSVRRAGGGRLTVHVAGAVRRPGVYVLPPGARVDDALRRAGGPRGRADLTAVNLAAKLEDGRQVLVPERAAAPAGGAAGAGAAAGAPAGGTAAAGGAVAPAAPVNLNTATLEQLDTLDGVGPGIAQRILDYRGRHGGFARVEELGEVPGIG